MEKLLNVHEAAELLGLSPRTLYNLVARDQIPVQRVAASGVSPSSVVAGAGVKVETDFEPRRLPSTSNL